MQRIVVVAARAPVYRKPVVAAAMVAAGIALHRAEVTGPEPGEDESPAWESIPRQPTDEETAALNALVAEILMRAK